MIDTHAHLNFEVFDDDYPQVIEGNFKNGLRALINVGSNFETSKKAIKIAQKFTCCYAAVGLHPIHVKDEKFEKEKYKELIKRNKSKIKALGETGLDFYHSKNDFNAQKSVFLNHLELSQEFNLPVILHCRGSKEISDDAYKELLSLINQSSFITRGVLHCFSAKWEIAQKFLKLGFYLGFDGPITFKNVDSKLLEAVKKIPLNKILLETDSPYLAPEPYRGSRNEPINVRYIALKISAIKNISFDKVITQTTENAQKLFNIKL